MLALLLQRYTLHPVPGFKVDIIAGISLVAKSGIEVRFERET
jgi:hypothetical protein